MRINLFVVGRLKAGPEKELCARYLDRLAKTGPAIGLEFGRVIEIGESRASSAEARKREEAAALRKHLADGSALLLLDERGRNLDSLEFAEEIGAYRDQGKREILFAIGGADGLDPDLHRDADKLVCLGRMTWPHQLARILLAEQLYRSVTILSGHPYHRA